jgi:sterol desaturase/sphingolipid hydroxylase (fatty acid hydroxylase superfamily)
VRFAAGFAAGLFGWTLLEYIIHRCLGHWPKGKTMVSAEHIHHHRDILYFSPLRLKIQGAVPVLGGAGVLLWLVFGFFPAAGAVLALALGWSTYEMLHKAIHVRGPHTRYGRWAARYHLYHHFMQPNYNHGVTTPLWDLVFRTHRRVDRVLVRPKDLPSIPWLARAFSQEKAVPAFRGDYALREPRGTEGPGAASGFEPAANDALT